MARPMPKFKRKFLTPTGWDPSAKKADNPIRDPNGVLAKFEERKRAEEARLRQEEEADLAERREHFRRTGELRPEPEPKAPEPARKGRGRKATPATLWVAHVDGSVQESRLDKTGEAKERAERLARNPKVTYARVLNDAGKGTLFKGAGWREKWHIGPGESWTNLPRETYVSLTADERRQVKEWECPRYIKPGEVLKDMSEKNPTWQSTKNSRKGQTWDRMRRSQGLK